MGNCPLQLYGGHKKDVQKQLKKVSFKRDSQGFVTVKYLPSTVQAHKKAVSVRPVVRHQPLKVSVSPERYRKGKKC